YRSLLKKMCMPVVRGPERKHNFPSFEEKSGSSFLKFNPLTPPEGPNFPLFPHRDDVPLLDPCSGLMSPGADADLQPNIGRAIENLVDYSDVKPHQRIPIAGKRDRTDHRRQMILLEEIRPNRRWNSRALSRASVKTHLKDCRMPVDVASALLHQNSTFAFYMNPSLKASESSDPSANWREGKAWEYVYKSSTQKAYEEVPWDNILRPKVQPPESTVEVMADPVSQCFTEKRYNLTPEMSQVVGLFWDRCQTRHFTSPQRPINL
ncbi:SPT48 protein, partial [Turnix velox]|nr:SPT48 protein [Turnix velox]